MMNYEHARGEKGLSDLRTSCFSVSRLTASKAAVPQIPKKILPSMALSHRTGIESLSSFSVSMSFCMSLEEKILSKVGRGT